jgi:V/A-type H+-transporting ATPase subunit A
MISEQLSSIYPQWQYIRSTFRALLQQEEELEKNVRLLGKDSLSEHQKAVLDFTEILRRAYLQQDSLDSVDCQTSLQKQYLMLQTLHQLWAYINAQLAKGQLVEQIFTQPIVKQVLRIREIPDHQMSELQAILDQLKQGTSNSGGSS